MFHIRYGAILSMETWDYSARGCQMWRIHFIPWEQGNDEFLHKAQEWKGIDWKEKHNFFWIKRYTGSSHQLFQSLTSEDDQIYVHGHGSPGPEGITSGGKKLSPEEVARRLHVSGLPEYFKGKIKCWICHNGEAKPSDAGDRPAFAQELINNLYYHPEWGTPHRTCKVFGYVGMVGSYPWRFPDGNFHRETAEPLVPIEGDDSRLRFQNHPNKTIEKNDARVGAWTGGLKFSRGRASGNNSEGEPNRREFQAQLGWRPRVRGPAPQIGTRRI